MTSDCLDLILMARYMEGDLSDAEKEEMENHLLSCEACLEEFIITKTVINDIDFSAYEPVPAEVVREMVEKVRNKIEHLIRWFSALSPPVWMMQYAASPVRSGKSYRTSNPDAVFVRKKMADLKTEIYVQKLPDNKICIWIKVFKGRKDAKNVSLTLMKEGGRPVARFLTKEYEFFDRLGFGTYSLNLEQNAQKKGSLIFQINRDGFYEKQHYLF